MKSPSAGISPDYENGCLHETAEETTDTRIKHVVLVHGACHGAWCWYKVVTRLLRRGFTVAAIDLTSMGKKGRVLLTLSPQLLNSPSLYWTIWKMSLTRYY